MGDEEGGRGFGFGARGVGLKVCRYWDCRRGLLEVVLLLNRKEGFDSGRCGDTSEFAPIEHRPLYWVRHNRYRNSQIKSANSESTTGILHILTNFKPQLDNPINYLHPPSHHPQRPTLTQPSLSALLSSLLRLSNRSKSPNPNSTLPLLPALSFCPLVLLAGPVTTFSRSATRTYGRRDLGLEFLFGRGFRALGRRFARWPLPEGWGSDDGPVVAEASAAGVRWVEFALLESSCLIVRLADGRRGAGGPAVLWGGSPA